MSCKKLSHPLSPKGGHRLTHPLGTPQSNQRGPLRPPVKGDSKQAARAPVGNVPAGVAQAVATLKPIVTLPGLAAKASNTELRRP